MKRFFYAKQNIPKAESEFPIVEHAMKNISAQTCIKFRRTSNRLEKQCIIQRKPKSTCYASVGFPMKGYNYSHLNLPKGCMVHKGIQHELLHTLGFFHMHNVPDRDKYVKVLYKNIKQNFHYNFKIYSVAKNLGFEYDYHSLMHYNPRDFSANGKRTIETRQKGVTVGGAKGMSEIDVKKLNRLYCSLYDKS